MLTNATVKAARAGAHPQKIWDEGGLFLHISPAGTKAWRCRFRAGARESTVSLGHWPEISLADAREARDRERARFDGRANDAAAPIASEHVQVATFSSFARTWLERQRAHWSAEHAGDVESYLQRLVFPAIGEKPIDAVTAGDIVSLLLAIEDGGARQLARRLRQWLAKIFRRAIAEQLVTSNPAAGVGDVLAPAPEAKPKVAVLELGGARQVLATIAATPATPAELLASQLLALTAVRSAAIRGAKWEEFAGIDWEVPSQVPSDGTWTIPAERMKLSVARKANAAYAHIVPLSRQAVEVLRAARAIAADSPFVFGGARAGAGLPINALSALYVRAGLQGRHCPHGWRATFSTIMNERRAADRQAIDAALAHLPKDKVEAAYNRSVNLPLRRDIFQEWADALMPPIAA